MKRIKLILLLLILSIGFFITNSMSMYSLSSIDKIKLNKTDIPQGYMIGKIPGFAKEVLKNNPWKLDRNAIKKLAHRIYPGGDMRNISEIHMTILAKNRTPYGDDIVCYILQFRDKRTAEVEKKKIKEFVGFNRDRSILVEKKLMAVYLIVDRTTDFPEIEKLSKKFKKKMEAL